MMAELVGQRLHRLGSGEIRLHDNRPFRAVVVTSDLATERVPMHGQSLTLGYSLEPCE